MQTGPLFSMAAHVLAAHWAKVLSGDGTQGQSSGDPALPPPFQSMALPPPPSAEEIAALAHRYSMMQHAQPQQPPRQQQTQQQEQQQDGPQATMGKPSPAPFLAVVGGPPPMCPPTHRPGGARGPAAPMRFPQQQEQEQRSEEQWMHPGVTMAPFAPGPQAVWGAFVQAAVHQGAAPKY
jgi:hypothetical protein